MTTKILTVRVPSLLYAALCQDAGEIGVAVSAHIRRLLERENDAQQIDAFRRELFSRIDNLAGQRITASQANDEVLMLCRAIAAHLNPQLVTQVRARFAQQFPKQM
jgi:hypothetical protein